MNTREKARRYISAILCFVMLIGCVTFDASAAAVTAVIGRTDDGQAAVYAYSDYEIEFENAGYVEGHADDGRMLTDRKYSSATVGSDGIADGWVKICADDMTRDFEVSITTDFGYAAVGVYNFYLRTTQDKSEGEYFPESVEFYVSEDGKSFTHVGSGTTDTDISSDSSTAIYRFVSEEEYTSRYVKTVLRCRGTVCLNEVAVAAKGRIFRANNGGKNSFKDEQGVIYQIVGNEATVVGLDTSGVDYTADIKPSSASFDEDDLTYTLGKGSDNEVTVISDFIGEGQLNYSGAPNNVRYIVIHNTGTTAESTDAERYNYRMHVGDNTSSWHYSVDENIIYHSLADSIAGWHAGPSHNYESIGIEICVNGAPTDGNGEPIFEGAEYERWVESRFRSSLKNTAVLVAELLTRYGLGTDSVIQHYDVSGKDCPMWMRYRDGRLVYNGVLWEEFMGYVEEYYSLLNGNSPIQNIQTSANIILPDYIAAQDGRIYPVTKIGANAFAEKDGHLKSLTLGQLINEIPQGCFDGSESLIRIDVADGNTKFSVGAGSIVYDSEMNIVFDPEESGAAEPDPKEGCILDIREIDGRHYIFCNEERYTLDGIAEEYGSGISRAFDLQGDDIEGSDIPGTGAVIEFEDGAKLYLVLRGDADGNAKTEALDYLLVKRMYFDTYRPLKRQLLATALTNGKYIEAMDYILLKRHYFGLYSIFEQKAQ